MADAISEEECFPEYMADAISEKERQSRGIELACVKDQRDIGGVQAGLQSRQSASPSIWRTPSARRSGRAAESGWHV